VYGYGTKKKKKLRGFGPLANYAELYPQKLVQLRQEAAVARSAWIRHKEIEIEILEKTISIIFYKITTLFLQ
jgi:hypothetical protein